MSKWVAGSRRVAALLAAWSRTRRVPLAHALGEAAEARELLGMNESSSSSAVAKCVQSAGELEARVRGDGVAQREHRVGVALAQPPHAGVVLDVDPRPDAELAPRSATSSRKPSRQTASSDAGRERVLELLGRERAHRQERGVGQARCAKLRRLRRRRDGEPLRAAPQGGARAPERRRGRSRRP